MDNRDKYKLLADVQFKTDLNEAQRKLYAGAIEALDKMPGAKIRDQIIYLEKQLLPAIERRKGGTDSPDYIFFCGLINSLKWTIIMYDRLDGLARRASVVTLENTLLRERLLLYERELTRYTTIEDLHLTDFMERYDKGVRDRLNNASEGKKS